MAKRFLIMDSGPLISLTSNGLLYLLEELKKTYKNLEIVIPPAVKREAVDRALTIKKYKLEGVKLTDLLNRGILKNATEFMPPNKISKETARIMKIANSLFRIGKEKVELIQKGEASCLAFARLCGCENLIVIDERTTRLLTEAPDNLKKLMERKLHTRIDFNKKEIKEFNNFRYIRSPELVFWAFKKDLIGMKKNKQLIDALLYSLKSKGAAISSKEIEEMKTLA